MSSGAACKRFREPLTIRQLQFVAHAANGLTYDEIAEREYVVRDTVKATLDEARRRAGANNITELVALVIWSGQLSYEDD